MNLVKAVIEKDHLSKGLWLTVTHPDTTENLVMALQRNEIKPIMLACKKYLKENL
jgi:hypothetical protein